MGRHRDPGDAFANAKSNNEDIEADDILTFANEVLILAGEIKPLRMPLLPWRRRMP